MNEINIKEKKSLIEETYDATYDDNELDTY